MHCPLPLPPVKGNNVANSEKKNDNARNGGRRGGGGGLNPFGASGIALLIKKKIGACLCRSYYHPM